MPVRSRAWSLEHNVNSTASTLRSRLFYDANSLRRLKHLLVSDADARIALNARGAELLAAKLVPESTAERGGGQHANYGEPGNQISEMGLTLGLLFHLTDDRRYAEKLRETMLYYATYARWTGQGLADRVPQWHSELNTAKFSFGFSTGYDALRNFLSAADKQTIADAMVRMAILPILGDWVLPGTRIHSLDSMGHNWWGVCVAGAGLCSLALLQDDPRAQGWIDSIDAGFIQWFSYSGNVLQNRVPTFEHSGPSYEGVTYTNYGVSEYLRYRLAWQNTFPHRRAAHMESLDHLATFFLHTLYPTSGGFYSVNFNDATLEADATETILLLISCGLGTADASRYLDHVHSHPEGALLSLLRQHPKPSIEGDVPTSCIYPEMGWATMRSSWQNDATLLAMKSGYTWNHAHADAGSFILFQHGKPLIIDSGTCDYARPEYNSYYRQSAAHNVILFDGAGQSADDLGYGCKFPGHMRGLIDGLGLKYVYADATGPMARWFSRNYRHWIWSGDLILVIDDVCAHTTGPMDWLLHFDGNYAIDSDSNIRLKNGNAEVVFTMLCPPVRRREETGLADHDVNKKTQYLAFRPREPARSCQFIAAICLNPDAVPEFEVSNDPDSLTLRVQGQDFVEEFHLDQRAINSPGTIGIRVGEWETDAYMLHIRRSENTDTSAERFFLGNGSYLRREGRSYIESLSKLTACWSPGSSLEIYSDEGSRSIQVHSETSPRSVRWNSRPIATHYDDETRLVSIDRFSREPVG